MYWIKHYNSTNPEIGYNETDSYYKSGGNTYKNKSEDEMKIISDKLRNSKIGLKNPNAKQIKCLNIKTNEELFFDTVENCREYFNEKTHRFITTRVNGITKSLYKNEWAIAYKRNNYNYKTIVNKRGKELSVLNLKTGSEKYFESVAKFCRECNINRIRIQNKLKDKNFKVDNYMVTVLN